jgi:hypothetical protein
MNAVPAGPFPRVYRYARWWRYIGVILAAAFIVGETVFWLHFLLSNEQLTLVREFLATATCVASILLGGYMIAAVSRCRVILHADGIEVIGVFRRRRIAYKDIGAKMAVQAFWPTWTILSTQRSNNSVMFEMAYDFDEAFRDWFAEIPKPDGAFWKQRGESRR